MPDHVSNRIRSPAGALVALVAALVVVDTLALTTEPPDAVATPLRVTLAATASVALLLAWYVALQHSPRWFAAALLLLPVVWLYALSGLLLPWNQHSYWVGTNTLEVLLAIPGLGAPLARALFGGHALSRHSLELAHQYHYALLALATLAIAIATGRFYADVE